MGKNKFARWAELNTLKNVIQPETIEVADKDHNIKGKWRSKIFSNANPVVLELACGKGEYTTGLAEIFPGRNFIGIDIKGARMWRGAKIADEKQLKNAAFLRTRIEFINKFFAEDEVDEIWILFPDPHSGKKNSNKRLTCPWFLNKDRSILKDGGIIHLKTDNSELYHYTEKLAGNNGLEILISTENLYNEDPVTKTSFYSILSNVNSYRENEIITDKILSIRTHYENIFLEEGLKINYLAFRLDKNKPVNEEW